MADRPSEDGIVVTVHPQQWVETAAQAHESGRRQLIDAEERDPVTFVVPREDATDSDGEIYPNKSYEANQLVNHGQAPAWVTDWDGPYFVTTAENAAAK